nr:MAG TPA: glycoprotein [Caudoviricetes sp.]
MFWFSSFLRKTCSIILWSMKTCFCHLRQISPKIDNQVVTF